MATERADAEDIATITACLAVAGAAKNRVLADMLANIKSLLHVWVFRAIRQSGEHASAIEQYRAALQAIRDRQPDAAFDAMTRHLETVTSHLLNSLDPKH